jgi:cytidine deaminase
MTDRQKQFEAELNEFPKSVRNILKTIPLQAGRLFAPQCTELIKYLGIDPEELMTRLLPLAKIYAVVPLSQFRVGAVAMAGEQGTQDHADPFELFLGANMEFIHQPLNQTIHAEQSATLHAWHQGALYLRAIAASEAPCGHCRQFLHEFENNAEMMVITSGPKNRAYRKTLLSDLLPEAFGPLDLGNSSGLMSPAPQDRKKTGPLTQPYRRRKNHMLPLPKILRAARLRPKPEKYTAAAMSNPRPTIRVCHRCNQPFYV